MARSFTVSTAMSTREEAPMSPVRSATLALCATFGLITSAAQVAAQGYPTKQIKMVVPFAAGSASDAIARIVAEKLGSQLGGNRILVDNRPGAGGNIGTAATAKAPPDGYTLLFSTSGPLAVNKSLYPNLPYDPEQDFEPISLVATLPNVLVVNPQIPASTTTEFIKYVKERPDQITYSSIGIGSSQHLAGVLFENATGTRMRHVPYRAAGQFVVDLMSGDVPVSFQLIPNVISQLKSGKIKAIAVMAKQRSKTLPDIPTMAEQGMPDLESAAWFGILVPRGAPQSMIDLLHRELANVMADPEIQTGMLEIGADPVTSSPAEFRALISAEIVKWSSLIKQMNITAE
jgi:tripartite-type tricarboxylate transporter receptor subunit TctC